MLLSIYSSSLDYRHWQTQDQVCLFGVKWQHITCSEADLATIWTCTEQHSCCADDAPACNSVDRVACTKLRAPPQPAARQRDVAAREIRWTIIGLAAQLALRSQPGWDSASPTPPLRWLLPTAVVTVQWLHRWGARTSHSTMQCTCFTSFITRQSRCPQHSLFRDSSYLYSQIPRVYFRNYKINATART